MNALSTDTDPRIEKIQTELLRRLTPERKFQMVAQMNYTVRAFLLAGLRRRNPQASPEMLRRMLADLLLGEELARKVFAYHAQ